MDFDIAGLLANPDVQYMMAGLGGAIGKDNPFAVAAGNMTQQGIAAQNQKKLLMALLGQGGVAKTGESIGSGYDKISKQFLGADPTTKISSDGKTATFTGPVGAFEGFGGGSPSPTPTATPPSGGQQGIINPSVGLPGDLSGLSLAGLKPEDINKAITLGLTGADLERKKVSDLYVNAYHQALVNEKIAARGAKDVLAPVNVPGVGQIPLEQFKAMPTETKAYAYAMHLRQQNGQGMISPEQFKREASPDAMIRLIERAGSDPKFMADLVKVKQAGAMNLGDLGTKQEQTNAINNFDSLKKPEHAKLFEPTKDENSKLIMENGIPGDPSYDKALTKFKINKALSLVKGTGVTVLEKDARIEGNELVIPVITKTGDKDVIRRPIR